MPKPRKAVNTQPEANSDPSQKQHQAMNNYENEVFVSYAWGGESERTVDELERVFTERGIRIVRDKKDLDYKGSIESFEQRIGQGRCVILIISDKYLRSEHCMYELVEADTNRNLRKRVFPIVLADAHIYKAIDRLTYIKHWDEQIERLNHGIKQVDMMTNLTGITTDLDKYARIRANFDRLTDLLSDMNALTPEMHSTSGFSTLINAVENTMIGKRPVHKSSKATTLPGEIVSKNKVEPVRKVTIDRTQIIVALITALAAILAAYWQFVWKPGHEPVLPEPITYVGRVIDSKNRNPIKGAQVALDFEGVPPVVYTDDNGVYRFSIILKNEKVDGRVRVDVTGYEKYERYITIYKNIPNMDDIRLDPVQSSTAIPVNSMPSVQNGVCGGKSVKIVLPQNPSDFNRRFGYTVYTTDNSYVDPNQGLLSNVIRSLFVDQSGIWIGYGMSNAGEKGVSFASNPADGARIWEMCLDRNGKVIGHLANSITADSVGSIWVATDGNGAWKLQAGVWDQFAKDDLVVSPNTLPERSTFTVVVQGNNILVGTLKGLFRYNGINWTKVPSLEFAKIHAVAFAGNGDVWIGFIDQGVRRILPDGAYQDFNTTNSQLTNDNIRSIVVDDDGRVWIATVGGGINIYSNGNWSFYRAEPQGIQSDNVNVLARDRFGRIWVGTDKGTSYFDASTTKWTLYTDLDTLAIGFGKSTHERCSYQDDPVWIGTNGQGLLNARLMPSTPIIRKYDISNLPTVAKPGEKLVPIVDIKLIDGYVMSTGDLLQSTETTEYTSSPIIAVDPDRLTDKGKGFQFSFSNNPIIAPQNPGNYKLVWRLWQCGRYVDPPISLEFTVVNP